MGIIRVTEQSAIYGLKLFWRLCTANSLCSKWIRNTYLRDTPLSLATNSLLDSGTRKLIVQHKWDALKYMIRAIGTSIDTYLWYDNWVRSSSLQDITGRMHPPDNFQIWHVSEIIEDNRWSMKEPLLMQCWMRYKQLKFILALTTSSGLKNQGVYALLNRLGKLQEKRYNNFSFTLSYGFPTPLLRCQFVRSELFITSFLLMTSSYLLELCMLIHVSYA